MKRLVETPHIMKQIMVLNRPIRMIGFLPNLSDAFPHGTAVILCDIEKTAPVMPAHLNFVSYLIVGEAQVGVIALTFGRGAVW
jgi:hypothetical protein